MADANTIIDRTLAPLRRALFGDPGAPAEAVRLTRNVLADLREKIDACLSQKGGEVSARVRAAEIGHLYLSFDAAGRARFLHLLAEEYDVDRESLDHAMAAVRQAADPETRRAAEGTLRRSLVPRRVSLLTQFNALPQGVKFLVDMRADLLPLLRRHPELQPLNDDLRNLLTSWFDIGFLDLRSIGWNAPAALLEKLMRYEAVHEIRSWQDLKNRLDSDRRCFAFFHARMPEEPLIFVEVALVKGMAGNVQVLLDEAAPQAAAETGDTAVFYSISNCQAGLAGVSFGNFLIKRVVDELCHELPNLKTFATLSPVPGLRDWLEAQLGEAEPPDFWSVAEGRALSAMTNGDAPALALRQLLARPGWHEVPELADCLRPVLLRACARYLLQARRGRRVADRVEHFHLDASKNLADLSLI